MNALVLVCCLLAGNGDLEAKAALALAFAPTKKTPVCGKPNCDCGCVDGEPCRCATPEPKPVKICECSPQCTCGCNEGLPCTCGKAKIVVVPMTYVPAKPIILRPTIQTVPVSSYVPVPTYFRPQPMSAVSKGGGC